MNGDINLIVAIGRNGEIGKDGNLIWRIPADLKRFKGLTMGHPVIMGRKTWESLPKRPLPGRRNIVLTRDKDYEASGAEIVHCLEEAISATKGESPFIIGGAEVYRMFLPYISSLYLTLVDAECSEADARLEIDFNDNWKEREVSDPEITPEGVSYRYVTLSRGTES